MKILIATLVSALALATSSCGGKDTYTSDTSVLPQPALATVTKNYSGVKISQIKIDKELFGSDEYEVILANGTQIDFKADGSLDKVKAGVNDTIPIGVLPDNIARYISENYAGQSVTEFEVDERDQEAKLASGMELKFDLQGNFLRIDR